MAEEELDTGEGQQDSDGEPETQTASQFREKHFRFEEGCRDLGEEVEEAFLLPSTSISLCFPPIIPWDTTSLPCQAIILPSAIMYVANSSHLHT